MNREELNKILDDHEKWLSCEGGQKADLRYADLGNASLGNANLRYANLYNANLCNTNLYNANLCNANLCNANLCNTNLYNANLRYANLYNANLCNANLYNANLDGADLKHCKGILSFTGEKHLLVYFEYEDEYFFKIGCITKTAAKWLDEFEEIGEEHSYGEKTKLYGDVIKLFSQYDLVEE